MLGKLRKLLHLIVDFPLGWCAVLAILLLDKVWMSNTLLKLPSSAFPFFCLLFLVNLKLLYHSLIVANILVSQKLISFFKFSLLGIEFILICMSAGIDSGLLSYLFCALDYPLVDQQLSLIDRAIGFNWDRVFQLSLTQPASTILRIAYASLLYQPIFLAGCFAFLRSKERLYEVFWILLVSALITMVISGFLPALGPAQALGLVEPLAKIQPDFTGTLSDVTSIRSGIVTGVEIHNLHGIVAFPSFHTVCAIIYMYGARKTRVGGAIFLVNVVMLISIPAFGDHYLVDMLAGAVVALVSIMGVRLLTQKQMSLPVG
jgi:hypothetical protein